MLNCICNDSVEHCGDGLGDGTAGLRVWLYCSRAYYAVPLRRLRALANRCPTKTIPQKQTMLQKNTFFWRIFQFSRKSSPVSSLPCTALPEYPYASQNSRALLSLAQLLGYVTRVAKFFTKVPADTTKKFENKAVCAALMRHWPIKMRHLMANSAPNTETWEAMLERLAGKTSIANEAATLIDALTTPPTTTATHTDEQAICPRRLNESAAGDQSSSDLVHSLTTPSSAAPGQKLDSSGLSDIGPLKCRTCG